MPMDTTIGARVLLPKTLQTSWWGSAGLVKLPTLCAIWKQNAVAGDASCGYYREWLSRMVKGGEAERAAWFIWAAGCLEPFRREVLLSTAGCIWDCWLCLQEGEPPPRQCGSKNVRGHSATQPKHLCGWQGRNGEAGEMVSLFRCLLGHS